MVTKVLLACHPTRNEDYQDFLGLILDKLPNLIVAKNVEKAFECYRQDPEIDLVFLDTGLPRSKGENFDETQPNGLLLADALKDCQDRPRIVLFCYSIPTAGVLERIQEVRLNTYFGDCAYINVVETPTRLLENAIKDAMALGKPKKPLHSILQVHVEIDNESDNVCAKFVEIEGPQKHEHSPVSIENFDRGELTRLIGRSKDLDLKQLLKETTLWKSDYNDLGLQFHRLIFGAEAGEKLVSLTNNNVESRQEIKYRFQVSPQNFAGMYEAIVPDSTAPFTLATAPIARQIYLKRSIPPENLGLKSLDRINILVIDASQTGGRALAYADHLVPFHDWLDKQEERLSFKSLNFGHEEVGMFQRLKQAMEAPRSSHLKWHIEDPEKYKHDPEQQPDPVEVHAPVGDVKILQWDGKMSGQRFEALIKLTLQSSPRGSTGWHIVHYIGHSVCTDPGSIEPSSYVILPGKDENLPIPAISFVTMLNGADTRFVYLSSCESASSDVAVSATYRDVKSSLGFRWPIEDHSAAKFSRHFYEALFSERLTLDEAVRDARAELHDDDLLAEDSTWASAIFVCQSMQWHKGDGETFKKAH